MPLWYTIINCVYKNLYNEKHVATRITRLKKSYFPCYPSPFSNRDTQASPSLSMSYENDKTA